MDREVGVRREVLAQQSVNILVGAALPGLAGVSEEHAVGEEGCDLVLAGHFSALVPGQSPPDFLRQDRHRGDERCVDFSCGVPAGEVEEDGVAALAVDQSADRRPGARADDQGAFRSMSPVR